MWVTIDVQVRGHLTAKLKVWSPSGDQSQSNFQKNGVLNRPWKYFRPSLLITSRSQIRPHIESAHLWATPVLLSFDCIQCRATRIIVSSAHLVCEETWFYRFYYGESSKELFAYLKLLSFTTVLPFSNPDFILAILTVCDLLTYVSQVIFCHATWNYHQLVLATISVSPEHIRHVDVDLLKCRRLFWCCRCSWVEWSLTIRWATCSFAIKNNYLLLSSFKQSSTGNTH